MIDKKPRQLWYNLTTVDGALFRRNGIKKAAYGRLI